MTSGLLSNGALPSLSPASYIFMDFKIFSFIKNRRAEQRLRIQRVLLTNSMALSVYLRRLIIALYALIFLCSSISPCLASYFDVCDHEIRCGVFEFGYPFGTENTGCGDPDFQIHCDQESGHFLIDIGGDEYRILSANIDNNNTMTIANNNLWSDKCNLSGNYSQFWLPNSRFHIAADTYNNLTIWGQCDQACEDPFAFKFCGDDWILGPEDAAMRFCKTQLQLPIEKHQYCPLPCNINQNFPRLGFQVSWQVDPNRFQSCGACFNSNGRCGYQTQNLTTSVCHCPDGETYSDKCPDNGTEHTEDRSISAIAAGCFVVGIAVTVIAVALAVLSVYDACKKRRNPPPPQILQGNGNGVTNPTHSPSAPETSLFTSTEKASSIENKV